MEVGTEREIEWYVNDGINEQGPFTWSELSEKVKKGKIPKDAKIKTATGWDWEPVTQYFANIGVQQRESEVSGLKPGVADVILYVGIFLGIVALFLYFLMPGLGIVVMIISILMCAGAVFMSMRKGNLSATSKLGNMIGIVWIVLEILVLLFLIMLWMG